MDAIETFRDIYSRLEIVSSIKPGDKLNTRNGTLSIDTLISRFSRTLFHNESRYTAVEYCTTVINDAHKFLGGDQSELSARLKDPLKRSAEGLKNLRATYAGDANVRGRLSALLHSVDMMLA
jgi:hypothetical protein